MRLTHTFIGTVLTFLASTTANAQVFNTTQSTTTLKERHYYPKQIDMTGIWYKGDTITVDFKYGLPPAFQNIHKSKLTNGELNMWGSNYKIRQVIGNNCKIVKYEYNKTRGVNMKSLQRLYIQAKPETEDLFLTVKDADTLQTTVNVHIRPYVRIVMIIQGVETELDSSKILILPDTIAAVDLQVADRKNKRLKIIRHRLSSLTHMDCNAQMEPGSQLTPTELYKFNSSTLLGLQIVFEDDKKQRYEIATLIRKDSIR